MACISHYCLVKCYTVCVTILSSCYWGICIAYPQLHTSKCNIASCMVHCNIFNGCGLVIPSKSICDDHDYLFLLTIGLSPVVPYICSKCTDSPCCNFEEHMCVCGNTEVTQKYTDLFVVYSDKFEGYHEEDNNITIKCAVLQGHTLPNIKAFSEILVVPNGSQIYNYIHA